MKEASLDTPRLAGDAPGIDWRNLFWAGLAVTAMVAVIVAGDRFLLTFVHVLTGVLWTGIDLFLGFVIGPILRRQAYPVRRAISLGLLPKTLFIMPTLATITSTSGWYLAERMGLTGLAWPELGWVVAAVAITAVLGVVGVGILLPSNLIVFLELRKREPDVARISRITELFFLATAFQGTMQIGIIVVMAKFGAGI